MRAWILEQQATIEERPLNLVEIPTPQPADDELRIRVLVCGVCRTDIHIAEGDLPIKKNPVVLGHEVVGVVDQLGRNANLFSLGEKVGVSWLHSSCGVCKYCLSSRENYCSGIQCTGWDADGGFAEYMIAPEKNALRLGNPHLAPEKIAPLLCPGIAGYAALKLTGTREGDKLGLYGFGPTAYYVLKVAQSMGIETYVSTRSPSHIEQARQEGADWVGNSSVESMPGRLDAAILFPPAGGLVEPALARLQKGGTLVMAPVTASRILIKDYSTHFWGRSIKTLYNVSRSDAHEFLRLTERLNLAIGTTLFPFEKLQDVLIQAKRGNLKEPAVVQVAE